MDIFATSNIATLPPSFLPPQYEAHFEGNDVLFVVTAELFYDLLDASGVEVTVLGFEDATDE